NIRPRLSSHTHLSSELETSDAATGHNPEPQLGELLQDQPVMSDAERAAEDDYLSMKIGPDVDVSGIERVPSAADNQPYRSCEKTERKRTRPTPRHVSIA